MLALPPASYGKGSTLKLIRTSSLFQEPDVMIYLFEDVLTDLNFG